MTAASVNACCPALNGFVIATSSNVLNVWAVMDDSERCFERGAGAPAVLFLLTKQNFSAKARLHHLNYTARQTPRQSQRLSTTCGIVALLTTLF